MFIRVSGPSPPVRRQAFPMSDETHLSAPPRLAEEACQLAAGAIRELLTRQDGAGRLTYVSPASLPILGFSPEELLGTRLALLLHPEDRETFQSALDSLERTASIGPLTWRLQRKDGSSAHVEISLHTLSPAASGEVLAVTRDISRQVAAEEGQRYAQKLESLGVMAGGLAHDLNNLLQALLGNLNILGHKLPMGAPGREEVGQMERVLRRAEALVRHLMDYADRGDARTEIVDLNRLAGDLLDLLRVSVSKQVRLEMELSQTIPPVKVDPAQFHQVILNLATNASEAMGNKSGLIRIRTGLAETLESDPSREFLVRPPEGHRYVLLEVVDNGPGIRPPDLPRIFDPFFTTKSKGRGLGLSAVLGIVRNHRAGLRVWSEPGKGSSFTVYLPAAGDPLLQPEPEPSQAQDPREQRTVLLVDDEEDIRSTTSAFLDILGYQALEASNGAEGLAIFKARQAELALVILDACMPEMSGADVLREILETDPTTKVILTTGYSEGEDVLASGFSRFLRKPYSLGDLRRAVQDVWAQG